MDVVTVKEASAETGMTVPRIMRRLRNGEINGYKIGWVWVIPRTELPKLK